ncbi:ABC-type transport auxiliary lipoprotein family protein [Pannonibacter phragmitetus]|uniref:ABC-type transport auxiliary lipoprotein family protein n=1 Tax=Pannonibacter phragmitetus TaxID=121719 RepID=UPI003D2ECD98
MTDAVTLINRRRALTLLGLGTLAAGLSACASTAPNALYGIEAPAAASAAEGARKPVQVLVAAPKALQALDSSNIAVVQQGPVYSYLPQVAWADQLGNVVQTGLVRTLENTRRLRGVGMPGDGLLIDYQLQTEIRSFELNVAGSARGVVEIAARLVNDRNGRTVDSMVFRAEVASGGQSADQAVRAMNTAAGQVFAELAAWVISKV